MDPELFSTLNNGAYMLGGFFDFVAFVALVIVALTQVRAVEPALGYGIAAIAGTRFLCLCGSRSLDAAFEEIPFNDMNGAVPMALTLISFVIPLLTLSLWASVIFALVRLRSRVPS
jgi:hypothetical protein